MTEAEQPVDVLNAMFMTKAELAQALGRVKDENERLAAELRLHKEGNPMTGFIEEAAKAKRYERALSDIIRGEDEAPVGMSNPAAVARRALGLSP